MNDYEFVSRKLVMYPDLNSHGRLFGGLLMSWIDEGLAQTAMRIMGTSNIVTKKFGEVVFTNPGRLGDSIEIWCRVTSEGRTSLSLECKVVARCLERSVGTTRGSGAERDICHSDVVYVALDESGRPKLWQPK